jgi:imidazolonepropionase-like amidohydrolase
MMLRRTLIGAALAVALAPALIGCATVDPLTVAPAGAEVVRYDNALWWTPEGFVPGERFVSDGRFVVDPGRAATRVVDMDGAHVTPPFAEAHNHNLEDAPTARAVSDTYLAAGILYVKNPNSRASATPGGRAVVNQADTVDAIFSMGGITAPGGHPIRLYGMLSGYYGQPQPGEVFEGDAFNLVTEAGQIGPVLDGLQAVGADFVKLYLLGSEHHAERADDAAFYGLKGLDPALAPLIVRAAHERGLKVAVHIETAEDFRAAVAAGVDEINHLPGYAWERAATADAYRLTEADARAAAQAGVVVVTTTVVSNSFGMTPARLVEVQALQAENLRRLHTAGVTLAIGSDSYQANAVAEVANLQRIGAFTAPELLRLWIDTGRASIFPDRRIGRLDASYEANFLVLGADPSIDLTTAPLVRAIYKAGRDITPGD